MQSLRVTRRQWVSALLALWIYFGSQLAVVTLAGPRDWNALWLVVGLAWAGMMLGLLSVLVLDTGQSVTVLRGDRLALVIPVGMAALSFLHGTSMLWDMWMMGTPSPGPGILLASVPESKLLLFVLMLLAFPAIAQELLYRHFLLALFPLERAVGCWSGILITSVLFAWPQWNGMSGSWDWSVVALGLVLGVARVYSGGIVAPVLLNSYAISLGLLADWAFGQINIG